jgi:hypothetical protein
MNLDTSLNGSTGVGAFAFILNPALSDVNIIYRRAVLAR